jgi:hypothetical protein
MTKESKEIKVAHTLTFWAFKLEINGVKIAARANKLGFLATTPHCPDNTNLFERQQIF